MSTSSPLPLISSVDCCLAFRKEEGLYSLLNIFHSSTEEKVRALCKSIVRRILQLNAELFLMYLLLLSLHPLGL